jgi:hypothetical protein
MGNVFGGMMAGTAAGSTMGGPAAGGPGTPPPIPGAAPVMPFFIAANGAQQGPFEVALLASKAASGELTRDTLVWCQGMASWTRAGDVPALASVFGAVPPPIPR